MTAQEVPVPPICEETLLNQPERFSVVSHSLMSGSNVGGFQCIIVLDSSRPFNTCLGLPHHREVQRNACFLQVTQPYEAFHPQSEVEEAYKMVISFEDYLNLFGFFNRRWPLICSKILASSNGMMEPDVWVAFSDHLHFIDLGMVCYSARLGSDLMFTAECRVTSDKGKPQPIVHAWITKQGQTLELPLPSCIKLFSSAKDYFRLEEQYKIQN